MRKVFRNRSCWESTAQRSYWQVHLQAWLRSGVTRSEYCRDNRINRQTMDRWIKALQIPVPKRRPAPKKQAKKKLSRMPHARTIAFKAFWMMHCEAQHESGLNATQYANAHRIPVVRMRRESRQFARIVPPQDWRELLHPSNRPPGAYRANLRQEIRQDLCISPLGGTAKPAPATDSAIRQRRQYTDQQKLAIVTEANEPGISMSAVAKRHRVTSPMICRWRDEFGLAPQTSALLLTARVIEKPGRGRPKRPSPLLLENLLPIPPGAISVELADGRRVYAPSGSDPDSVRQYIANKELNP